jgi:hypothetical protein
MDKTYFSHLQVITKLALAFYLGVTYHTASSAERVSLAKIEESIGKVAQQLHDKCPVANADNQAAFDSCRQFLFRGSLLMDMMAKPVVIWGRQTNPDLPLKDTNLTQFAPDVLSGLYIPLFMFDGQYKVVFHEREKMYLATLNTGFRNRLPPGQFPYPFWHDSNKWLVYEGARTLLLWIDPVNAKIRAAQFSVNGDAMPGRTEVKVQTPAFDGKWLWTDQNGQTQPAVTLFDGLFRNDNPFKPQLDKTYREFAITLRESQCLSCHVPNNPDKMKRLVLLQSPAHASGEISRVLKAVRDKKMPLDDLGMEKELDGPLMRALLEKGTEFEKVVNSAKEWERQQPADKN